MAILEEVKDTIDLIIPPAQFLLAAAAAVWAYFRFAREGTHEPRVEFDLHAKAFSPVGDKRGLSVILSVANKGNVEHRLEQISLRIRAIRPSDAYENREDDRWRFPHKPLEVSNIIPSDDGYYFIRPNVTQQIHFPTIIPADCTQLLIWASFKYQNSNDPHTVERVIDPNEKEDAS